MACYNTFVVVDCKTRRPILTTSSARKSLKNIDTGYRIEVWNNNQKVLTVYNKNAELMAPYIQLEKEYIRNKQAIAEERNRRRKQWHKN